MNKNESKVKFHKIWSSCVRLPRYNKKHWSFLNNVMETAMAFGVGGDDLPEFVLLLATLYKEKIVCKNETQPTCED